ncbi:MAG: hypothetical protein RSE56_02880 [Bacilli bacterium]
MNDEIIVEKMITYIEKIEKEISNQKLDEKKASKNAVDSILDELERLINYEDK